MDYRGSFSGSPPPSKYKNRRSAPWKPGKPEDFGVFPKKGLTKQNSYGIIAYVAWDAKSEAAEKLKRTHGGVAHLGERLNGIQKVVGSIPIVSTNKKGLRFEVLFYFVYFSNMVFCFAFKNIMLITNAHNSANGIDSHKPSIPNIAIIR